VNLQGRRARLGATLAVALFAAGAAPPKTLDIYFIDVEGGQSTLVVTPAGQSLLVDTGYAGGGFNDASNRGRDARRIAAIARGAGVKRIDFLLTTHFHADHVGGVVDLVQQIPIRTFIDHGRPAPETETDSIGTLAAFNAYAAVRAKGRHLEPKPGDRIPLNGVDAVVVSSALATIVTPLAGAGGKNSSCPAFGLPAQEANENPRSTGFLLRFGKFRFLDVGDLTGQPLFALACPNDVVGPVDVYLVAHHGGADAADPATLAAFRPRVAILNNGERKGGAPEMFAALRRAGAIEAVWQLHRSANPGAENFSQEQIANLDETTAHWIKVSASSDGAFRVTNGRTAEVRAYPAR
jgi:beta-lactamase superfamily II metal-dependent hydrolase